MVPFFRPYLWFIRLHLTQMKFWKKMVVKGSRRWGQRRKKKLYDDTSASLTGMFKHV